MRTLASHVETTFVLFHHDLATGTLLNTSFLVAELFSLFFPSVPLLSHLHFLTRLVDVIRTALTALSTELFGASRAGEKTTPDGVHFDRERTTRIRTIPQQSGSVDEVQAQLLFVFVEVCFVDQSPLEQVFVERERDFKVTEETNVTMGILRKPKKCGLDTARAEFVSLNQICLVV